MLEYPFLEVWDLVWCVVWHAHVPHELRFPSILPSTSVIQSVLYSSHPVSLCRGQYLPWLCVPSNAIQNHCIHQIPPQLFHNTFWQALQELYHCNTRIKISSPDQTFLNLAAPFNVLLLSMFLSLDLLLLSNFVRLCHCNASIKMPSPISLHLCCLVICCHPQFLSLWDSHYLP